MFSSLFWKRRQLTPRVEIEMGNGFHINVPNLLHLADHLREARCETFISVPLAKEAHAGLLQVRMEMPTTPSFWMGSDNDTNQET